MPTRSDADQTPAESEPTVFDCACFNARQAARAITGLYDEVIEPVGLKITQFAILATIFSDRDATMQTLAAKLGVDPSTMTRTLRPLADEGLVEVLAGRDGDRRVKRLALTSLGRHKLGEGKARWEAAQKKLSEKIGPEVFERLIGDLSAVTKALRD